MDGRALDSDRRGNRLFWPVPSSVSGIGLYLEASMIATQYPNYLTTRQAARVVGVAEVTLKRWRAHGSGPAFYRRGSRVLYIAEEVQAWGESQRSCAA